MFSVTVPLDEFPGSSNFEHGLVPIALQAFNVGLGLLASWNEQLLSSMQEVTMGLPRLCVSQSNISPIIRHPFYRFCSAGEP